MNIVEAYIRSWLMLLLFRSDSTVYEESWSEICRLESVHNFSPAELQIMRRLARQWWHAARITE